MKKALVPFLLIFYVLSLSAQGGPNGQETAQEALNASQQAYERGDYDLAQHYANLAIKDSLDAEKAAEIKIGCMEHLMRNSADSTQFIIAALELHRMDPENLVFLKSVVDYYSRAGHLSEMENFIGDELRENPADKNIWALKGELLMRKHRWKDAIDCYQQTVKLDSSFVEAVYNLGICYSSRAMKLKDSLENNRGKLNKKDMKKVLSVFKDSKVFLEKARVLDPTCETVDWKKALYQVYYVLGERKKTQAIKSIL